MSTQVAMERNVQTLGQLLHGIVDFDGERANTQITGISDDSRRIEPGGLFLALAGSTSDGRRYVDDAIRRGATTVVGEGLLRTEGIASLAVKDARRAAALIAARWHGLDTAEARRLKLLGVTGTNGKSTTTFMTRAILRAAGIKCGMLGTVHYDLCSRSITADMTTPGPLQLASYLRECLDAGAGAAVMEVSSHALDQKRTDGLQFAAAAFTNLTGDHLDYHKTMDAYGDAKARLFANLAPDAIAILNRDDPAWERMTRDCQAQVRPYSIGGPAELCATITRNTVAGTLYRMRIDGQDVVLENALVGRHNVYNALAAAGLARAIGVPLKAIEEGLASVRTIPGRLQRVPGIHGAAVFVDYAHTDDALRNVLSVLKPLTKRRLICVFGCGGDRDRTKRPRMAQVAAELASCIVVTSDNPRTEEPRAIIDEILTGFDETARRRVLVEPDRRVAIRVALAGAGDGDVVLIAGKGHEDYQIIGTEKHHFDDIEVAIQAASELGSSTAQGKAGA